MNTSYSKQEYLTNISSNEFIKLFILKLEKKLLYIYKISELIKSKNYIINLQEHDYINYYIKISSSKNKEYLTKDVDYILENDIINLKEKSLNKLMYLLISEVLESIHIFENIINDEKNLFINLLKELVFNMNSLVLNNNNINFYKNIKVLEKFKGI